MSALLDLEKYKTRIREAGTVRMFGRVTKVNGLMIESNGPPASIGDLCRVGEDDGGGRLAEVIGFDKDTYYLMTYGDMGGISPGSRIYSLGRSLRIPVGEALKGRIINGLGEPIDGKGPIVYEELRPIQCDSPPALSRNKIELPFRVGIKAIDGCLPMGVGQRIGIFSGSGVGKSTLLGMMAKGSESDINVIALIGERGREVREFIENDLGEEGLKKSVVVVVTGDQPALMRLKGAYVATTVAEYFRDRGNGVLLMMDSLTRFAMAQREIGLSLGEPPTTKGYTPSVFTLLPRLLERTGMAGDVGITAFYTILVDADDFNEPISDACRAILDGHIVLSRKIAAMNHYPAIDVLESVSRLSEVVSGEEQLTLMKRLKSLMAVYNEARDLINIGAYVKGSNPMIDEAISRIDSINLFLRQGIHEIFPFEQTLAQLRKMFKK